MESTLGPERRKAVGNALLVIIAVVVSALYMLWGIGFHRLQSHAVKSHSGMAIDILIWPIGLFLFAFDSSVEF